jgi:hypothetical protein
MSTAIDDLMAKLKATKKDAWQYLEVKQLAEILARHREKVRLAVREYRMHKRTHKAENDAIEKLYLGYEGIFLRDHLRDAMRLYLIVNHDYHEAYRAYMADLKAPQVTVITPIVMVDQQVKRQLPRGKKAA